MSADARPGGWSAEVTFHQDEVPSGTSSRWTVTMTEHGTPLGPWPLRVSTGSERMARSLAAQINAGQEPVAPEVTDPLAALPERFATVLAEHNIECTGRGEVTCIGCRDRGWMTWPEYRKHVAAALVAAVADQGETDA